MLSVGALTRLTSCFVALGKGTNKRMAHLQKAEFRGDKSGVEMGRRGETMDCRASTATMEEARGECGERRHGFLSWKSEVDCCKNRHDCRIFHRCACLSPLDRWKAEEGRNRS